MFQIQPCTAPAVPSAPSGHGVSWWAGRPATPNRGGQLPCVFGAMAVHRIKRGRWRPPAAFGKADLLQLEMQSNEPEALSELLEGLGAESTAVQGADGLLRETAMDRTPTWKSATVTGMFPADVDIQKIVAVVQKCFDFDEPPLWRITRVQDIDWVEHVQRSWQPMKLGRSFEVLLPWHEGPSGGAMSEGRRVLRLEGGAAFGLGDHPTTQGAVEFLEKVLSKHMTKADRVDRVLDYGTGSGVLAICAVHLGASTVVGVDVDEGSIDSAKRSCVSSLGAEKIVFLSSPEDFAVAEEFAAHLVQDYGPFQVVVANILRRPLVGLAPALARSCENGGRLALTGLRVDLGDGEAVRQAFSPAFHSFVNVDLPGGWLLVEAERAAEKGIYELASLLTLHLGVYPCGSYEVLAVAAVARHFMTEAKTVVTPADAMTCRICLESDTSEGDELLAPCLCCGSAKSGPDVSDRRTAVSALTLCTEAMFPSLSLPLELLWRPNLQQEEALYAAQREAIRMQEPLTQPIGLEKKPQLGHNPSRCLGRLALAV
ncbi:Ribosomal protein L11 methyltransferase (L11 Mtase) [Durusdinium trenchii]|uniref:ETFB lysine methyltransferase n=1 Tax=Durusdinium trenchii TaxID=1381693 RepID=A0ABP0S1A8_9DINO